MLASRGVDATLNDDIVQEVAVRALDKQVPFTDPDDLYRWAATAARRLHIDHLRSDWRVTGDDSLVLVADGTDVAHAAERRVALNHVWRAIAVMRPGERDAILDSLEDKEARSSLVLVRRHRARASLKKAVGGLIAWAALAQLRLRDLAQPINATAAAAVLAPALALGATPASPIPATPPARVAVADGTVARTSPGRAGGGAPAAHASRAERSRPGTTSRDLAAPDEDEEQQEQVARVGPLEAEPDNETEQKSNVCIDWHEQDFWCSPVLPSPSPRPSDPRP